jgi:mRNA interferase RelE/StbE
LTYALFIEKRAERALSRIARQDQERIADAIRRLADEPRPPGVKQLSARVAWRLRVGDYRMLYEIHDGRSPLMPMISTWKPVY